jgi:hypothetical protein
MNERLVVLSKTLVDPTEGNAIGANASYFVIPNDMTIVYISVAPSVDDAGATLDINDDGTGVITGVDASDKDAPGTWSSTHFGGTNAPVTVDGGSKISLDINNGAAATAFYVDIYALTGEV